MSRKGKMGDENIFLFVPNIIGGSNCVVYNRHDSLFRLCKSNICSRFILLYAIQLRYGLYILPLEWPFGCFRWMDSKTLQSRLKNVTFGNMLQYKFGEMQG